jgi:hypothetical protein
MRAIHVTCIGMSCLFVFDERFSVEITGVKKKNKKKSIHIQVQIRRSSRYRCGVLVIYVLFLGSCGNGREC